MNGKIVIIFIVSVAFFTLAAKYRFHDSAHVMGMLKKGGGMVRHPPVLDKDRDTYMLIATAGVVPPYQGNARVVLEGDPTLTATFYNSEPAVDLSPYRHPKFRDNTYYDLRPKDRIGLWVKIKRGPAAAQPQNVAATPGKPERVAAPDCVQCEPEEKEASAGKTGRQAYAQPAGDSGGKPRDSAKGVEQAGKWKGNGKEASPDSGGSGSRWRGKSGDTSPAKGPTLAFYDTATNEPLLRIPIRFTGGAGGGGDDH